jgi:hypothetical protein
VSEFHPWTFVLAGELNAASPQEARRTLRAVERLLNARGYVARTLATAHPPLDEWEDAAICNRRRLERRLAPRLVLDGREPDQTPK